MASARAVGRGQFRVRNGGRRGPIGQSIVIGRLEIGFRRTHRRMSPNFLSAHARICVPPKTENQV